MIAGSCVFLQLSWYIAFDIWLKYMAINPVKPTWKMGYSNYSINNYMHIQTKFWYPFELQRACLMLQIQASGIYIEDSIIHISLLHLENTMVAMNWVAIHYRWIHVRYCIILPSVVWQSASHITCQLLQTSSCKDHDVDYLIWARVYPTCKWQKRDPQSSRQYLTLKWHHQLYLYELTYFPLDKMDAISQTIFSDGLSWMKSFVFWLKLHWNLFLLVQLTMTLHWFWYWLGDE